jgi:DNA-directed RNA polymerase subunit F
MAGNLKISGEVRNCTLLASGDIQAARVVGGSLTAGGTVQVGTAGDKDGTTTELWAGHNLSYEQQNKLAKLEAERLDTQRSRLIAECRQMESDLALAQGRNQRLIGAQFVRKEALDALQRQVQHLSETKRRLAEDGEHARQQLAHQRRLVNDLTTLGDNDRAAVQVGVVAHAGVVVRLADIEPETLSEPRLHYTLGRGAAGT